MRHTIANAFATVAPAAQDSDDDRRQIDAPGFPPRLPSAGRRESSRSRVLLSALIVDLDQKLVLPCRIENVSDGGARLKLSERRLVPPKFWVIALTSGLAYRANLVWREDDRLGVTASGEPARLNDAESLSERRLQKIWLSWRGS